MRYKNLDVDMNTVYDWVWKLAFRELSDGERLELGRELIQCSLFDQERRYRALEALEDPGARDSEKNLSNSENFWGAGLGGTPERSKWRVRSKRPRAEPRQTF